VVDGPVNAEAGCGRDRRMSGYWFGPHKRYRPVLVQTMRKAPERFACGETAAKEYAKVLGVLRNRRKEV